jgi:hypothetical protein
LGVVVLGIDRNPSEHRIFMAVGGVTPLRAGGGLSLLGRF